MGRTQTYNILKIAHIVIDEIKNGRKLSQAIKIAEPRLALPTWYYWEKHYEKIGGPYRRLRRLRMAASDFCDEKRTEMVEDAFFKKLVEGTANSADYIFYLMNRRPDRWQDRRAMVAVDQSQHLHIANFKEFLEDAYRNNGKKEAEPLLQGSEDTNRLSE